MRRDTLWTVASAAILVGFFGGIFADVALRSTYRMIESVWPRAFAVGLPLGLVIGALVLAVARPGVTRATAAAFVLGMMAAAVATTEAVMKAANGALDQVPAMPLRAVVAKVAGGKTASLVRIVEPGRLDGHTVSLPREQLPRTQDGREAREGDPVEFVAQPGRLGLAWWRELRPRAGP